MLDKIEKGDYVRYEQYLCRVKKIIRRDDGVYIDSDAWVKNVKSIAEYERLSTDKRKTGSGWVPISKCSLFAKNPTPKTKYNLANFLEKLDKK